MLAQRIGGGLTAVAILLATAGCGAASGTDSRSSATESAAPEPTTVSSSAGSGQASEPPEETLTPLMEKALPNVDGKTFTSAVVEFPPGARAKPHRHGDAFVYAYVLSGTIDSQIGQGPVKRYHEGENWTEEPGAHHVLTENVSTEKPAELLVTFVSNTGDELKIDDPAS